MGYFDKLEDNSLAIRNLAGIVMGVAGAKEKIANIWPLRNEAEAADVPGWGATPKEAIFKILKAHGVKK
jgi:hypothetical protein